ncbi:hypothetical protein E2C01_094139 [Portunus trituberculatus]|uniref:Uncharacterized protein n=1 Tax=Portunus trituberculatus TaxID=210409 RepID=A0A5B7K0T4_PORTR|nr:hypothetical protein [Portunus trituberculatus]
MHSRSPPTRSPPACSYNRQVTSSHETSGEEENECRGHVLYPEGRKGEGGKGDRATLCRGCCGSEDGDNFVTHTVVLNVI